MRYDPKSLSSPRLSGKLPSRRTSSLCLHHLSRVGLLMTKDRLRAIRFFKRRHFFSTQCDIHCRKKLLQMGNLGRANNRCSDTRRLQNPGAHNDQKLCGRIHFLVVSNFSPWLINDLTIHPAHFPTIKANANPLAFRPNFAKPCALSYGNQCWTLQRRGFFDSCH